MVKLLPCSSLAAPAAHRFAGAGQAQAYAASLTVARAFDAKDSFEHRLALLGGDPQSPDEIYGFFMPSPWRGNRAFTALLRKLSPAAIQPLPGVGQMNILDGLSLAMAIGLFIYLLVALLRADRS